MFIKINDSTIINTDRIVSFNVKTRELTMITGKVFPVDPDKVKELGWRFDAMNHKAVV